LVGFFVKALAGVGSSGAEFIKPGGNSIDGEVGAWEEKTGEGMRHRRVGVTTTAR
jgi:hypothetical protein